MSKLVDEQTSTQQTSPPPAVPTRRRTRDYFSPLAARERFGRWFVSREKVMEFLKTLVIVIPVTLIIWIYAEQEQVVVPQAPNVQDVPVRINSSDPNLDVEMVGGPDQKVSLKLTGPQQALERVRQQLTSNIPNTPRGISIDLRSTMPVGNNEAVNIAERIQSMEPFKSNGVTVLESLPPSLYVNIDEHLHKDLPVEVPPSVTTLTADTRFEPPKVTVSGPRHLFLPGLKVYADLAGKEELNTSGSHTITGVHVMLSSPQGGLSIDPQLVKADIVVGAADEDYKIDKIPIYIKGPALLIQNNNITLTGGYTVPNTIVSGPPDQIEKLKDGRFSPQAELDVFPEDTGNPQARRQLNYILPEGVKVKPESLQEVDFTLAPK